VTSIRFEPELSAEHRNPVEPEFTFGFTLVTHSSAPNLASSRGLADESWPAPSKLQESRVQGFLARPRPAPEEEFIQQWSLLSVQAILSMTQQPPTIPPSRSCAWTRSQ
jgi:hypothetical protein